MGRRLTNWELGFKQCSFHHIMQVLQDNAFCAFSASPALPPCCFPLCLSTSGKVADLRDIPSIPGLLRSYIVLTVATHGDVAADREAALGAAQIIASLPSPTS